jgi:hypothetical protein
MASPAHDTDARERPPDIASRQPRRRSNATVRMTGAAASIWLGAEQNARFTPVRAVARDTRRRPSAPTRNRAGRPIGRAPGVQLFFA